MFHKILIPIDFSACSINALKVAADFAKKNKAQITILNVFSLSGTQLTAVDSIYRDVLNNLKELEDQIHFLQKIKPKYEVDYGVAADKIVDRSHDFDLIIMGTRGEHNIFDKLIGSVSLSVIEHADIPVLLIPEMLKEISFAQIVFAADFKRIEHMSTLDKLRELALAYDSELHLLNVKELPEQITQEEGDVALSLHQFFIDVNHAFFFSENGDIEKGILCYLQKKDINVLALMPRKHSFIKSLFHCGTTENVTMHLNSALFTFPE